MEWLREAMRRVRKDAAVGVDGQSWTDYEANLEGNLQGLLERFKQGTYVAPPVRRVHIPKGDGRTRPIGIPTLEDKILQRAVTMMLEAIYEQDFKPSSYGFRPGRSAHGALQALWNVLMEYGGGTIIDADIADFFGTLDHGELRGFLDQRVTDGVLRKVIHKWLKAGVMEGGAVMYPEAGTPQGGVISPLLANIYLHEVLDKWFEQDVQPRLQGRAQLLRYADDFVLVFEREDDARRVMAVLPKRFGKYGLKLHPEKTRLVAFKRPSQPPGQRRGGRENEPAPETFEFLGFTHLWGVSRKNRWYVQRTTAPKRLTRALDRIRQWCRRHRHDEVADQHRVLTSKLRGHYGYYGITGNTPALSRFAHEVLRIWRKWLDRRSQRASMGWEKFNQLLARYPLPRPRVVRTV
jgi:group II intron reverse transcriptase/maturase